MGLLPPDFESGAYTNFATQARTLDIKTLRRIRQEQPRVFEIPPVKFKRKVRQANKNLAIGALFVVKFLLSK